MFNRSTPGWVVTVYFRSELPLTEKVPPVMSIDFLVRGADEPDDSLCRACAECHLKNAVILAVEVVPALIPLDNGPRN